MPGGNLTCCQLTDWPAVGRTQRPHWGANQADDDQPRLARTQYGSVIQLLRQCSSGLDDQTGLPLMGTDAVVPNSLQTLRWQRYRIAPRIMNYTAIEDGRTMMTGGPQATIDFATMMQLMNDYSWYWWTLIRFRWTIEADTNRMTQALIQQVSTNH